MNIFGVIVVGVILYFVFKKVISNKKIMNEVENCPRIAELTKKIQENPNDAINYCYRADAYVNKEAYNLAIKDFTKAIALNPNNAEAYNNRGTVYSNYKKMEWIARMDFKEAMELDPNQPTYRRNYDKSF